MENKLIMKRYNKCGAVVEIIKVSAGLRLRILVDLPEPLSPTIAIISAIIIQNLN